MFYWNVCLLRIYPTVHRLSYRLGHFYTRLLVSWSVLPYPQYRRWQSFMSMRTCRTWRKLNQTLKWLRSISRLWSGSSDSSPHRVFSREKWCDRAPRVVSPVHVEQVGQVELQLFGYMKLGCSCYVYIPEAGSRSPTKKSQLLTKSDFWFWKLDTWGYPLISSLNIFTIFLPEPKWAPPRSLLPEKSPSNVWV